MRRRTVLASVGIGTTALMGGYASRTRLESGSNSPSHNVQVANGRSGSHEVIVELTLEGETNEYGPEPVGPGGQWEVERIESEGRLSVRASVDDELVWEDTHGVPTQGARRQSFARMELQSDGEVLTFVEVED